MGGAMRWQQTAVLAPDHALPLLADVEICVVGGGAAGVAAAETAARHGKSVLLIERYGFCGGNAVAGLSGTICGLYLSSERNVNRPEQAVFGFTERFRAAMAARGGITPPQRYGRTLTVTHDPLVWREVADDFLADAKVRLLFHSLVVGVVMEGDTLRGVVVESKAGRGVVQATRFIDASGDADLVARAGLAFTLGQDGTVQNPTMIFRLGGVDVPRFLDYWGEDTICRPEVTELLVRENRAGRADLGERLDGLVGRAGPHRGHPDRTERDERKDASCHASHPSLTPPPDHRNLGAASQLFHHFVEDRSGFAVHTDGEGQPVVLLAGQPVLGQCVRECLNAHRDRNQVTQPGNQDLQ